MVNNSTFTKFEEQNPQWKLDFKVYQRDDWVYQRVICPWQEGQKHHEFHACINVQNGDLYLDCRRRKILAKHIVLSVIRPIHTIIKTLWHASIIAPLAVEIYKVAKKQQTMQNLGKNTLHSLADIVRTPLYGVAMTIINIAGVAFGCLSPNSLYKTRELAGRLERKMLRVDYIHDGGPWVLSPCFSPAKNIARNRAGQVHSPQQAHQALTTFAQKYIECIRKNRSLFDDCFLTLFPEDKTYISSARKAMN